MQQIVLRDYQVKYLRHLQANRLSIMLSCRQAAKTTTSAIFMLWYTLFNTDKNSLVVGNKRKTAIEILDKTKKIFIELPFFLRPGVYKWNESEPAFDNGCRIMAEATTINSGISFTFHCILSDEFAHLPANILDKFYNNATQASKDCTNNGCLFIRPTHIDECIEGKRKFAGVTADEKTLHWKKFSLGDLNKRKDTTK